MPSRFFFIVIFAQIASVPELPEKKKKTKKPQVICSVFCVHVMGRISSMTRKIRCFIFKHLEA